MIGPIINVIAIFLWCEFNAVQLPNGAVNGEVWDGAFIVLFYIYIYPIDSKGLTRSLMLSRFFVYGASSKLCSCRTGRSTAKAGTVRLYSSHIYS